MFSGGGLVFRVCGLVWVSGFGLVVLGSPLRLGRFKGSPGS